MARKINKETVVDPIQRYTRIWTFRTQELMDLWINEMQGQISDGMWENSRGTEWLWQGADIYTLGKETKLILLGQSAYGLCDFKQPRMSYPLGKELIEVVGDRAMEESGFSDLRQLKEAWRELNEAIKNPQTNTTTLYEEFSKKPRELAEAKRKQNVAEAFSYVKDNLADIIKVDSVWEGSFYLSSLVQNIGFCMNRDNGKVKVSSYKGKFEAEVSPNKVKETVKFIQDVLWR